MVGASTLASVALVILQPFVASSAGTTIRAILCGGAPSTPIIVSPADGAVVATPSVLVSGLADIGSTVSVTVDGVPVANIPTASDGTYSATVPLAVGSNAIRVQAITPCGSSGLSPPVSVVYQPVIPAAPVITSPPTGSTTQADTVEVVGTAAPLSTVTIYRNGIPAAIVTADAFGSFGAIIGLPIGTSTLTATASNGSGSSPPSNSVIVNRLQSELPPGPTPPAVVVPTQPATGGGIALITSPASGTEVTTPAVSVSGTAQPFSTVIIRANGVIVAYLQANSVGIFGGAIGLLEGQNSLTAQQVGGPESPVVIVIRKTAMITPPVITSPADGDVINAARVNVEGSALPGAKVTLYRDGKLIGWVTADQNGRFKIELYLHAGRNVLIVNAQLGGASLDSAAVTVYHPLNEGVVAVAGNSLLEALKAALSAMGGVVLLFIGGATALAGQADLRGGLWLLMLFGLLVLAGMRGWYGLEQMYVILGWRRHRPVYDALTGKRVRLVSWQRVDIGYWMVHKIGYVPQQVPVRPGSHDKIILTPQPLYASSAEFLLSELLLILGFVSIPLIIGICLYLWSTLPLISGLYGALAATILGLQIIVAWAWPKTRWGRVEGVATDGLSVVEITNARTGQVAAEAQINRQGYFAAFVSSGHYLITIRNGSKQLLVNKIASNYRSGYITKHYHF